MAEKELSKDPASNLTPNERLMPTGRNESRTVPLFRQAKRLSPSRGRLYDAPRSARKQEVRIRHRLDEWYTKRPCLGAQNLAILSPRDRPIVGRRMNIPVCHLSQLLPENQPPRIHPYPRSQ